MAEAVLPRAGTAPRRWSARGLVIAAGAAAGLAALVLVIYPSLVLVANSLLAGGRLTLAHYDRIARDADVYRTLLNSLTVSVASALAATGLGATLAWLVARTDLPGRGWWHTLLVLPYMIPPFVGAIAWVYLLGPVGYLNELWMWLSGSPDPIAVIYGPAGIIFLLTLYGYPIAYVTTLGVLERMNPALEEAARMARARPPRVLWDVTLPLVLPGVLAGGVLVLMSSLANFGIPAVVGFPARYFVLPTKIYSTILNYGMPNNLNIAAAMSMLLVAVAGVLLMLQRLALRRGRYTVVTGQAATPHRVELGRWRWPAAAGLGLVVTIGVALPLGAILLTSLIRAYGLPPTVENLSTQHWGTVLFGVPKVQRALLNSVALAAGAAALIVALALGIAYLIARLRVRGAHLLEYVITIPYAVPGTVVALAMILAWVRPIPLLGIRLYDTIWILVVAYVARFLVFGVRTVMAGLTQVHESLEEAARISGARPGEAFRDVVLPIIRPSIAAGWFLVFIPAVAELTLSILLFSVGNETLGVVIFGLHEEGKIALSAALAFLITAVLVTLHLVSRAVTRRELVS